MDLYKFEPVKLHKNVSNYQSKITVKYLLKTLGKLTQEHSLANEKYELWRNLKTGSNAVVVDFELVLNKSQ